MAWTKTHTKEVNELLKLSFDDLLDRKQEIDIEIRSRQGEEVEKLRGRVQALSDALHISNLEFLGVKAIPTPGGKKERKKKEFKAYVNPDNPEETYRGAGKRPKWLQDKLDAGAQISDFLLPSK